MSVRTPQPLDLRYPAGIEAVPQARRESAQWLSRAQVTPPITDELLLVITELVTNAVEASPGPLAHVVLHVEVDDDHERRVVINVSDEGEGFDSVPEERFPSTSQMRGRGLPIVHALTDDVVVQRRWGRTEIEVTRSLPPNGR